MKKRKEEKFEIDVLMFKIIKSIVREFNLTEKQEQRLHEIAIEDIKKLWNND